MAASRPWFKEPLLHFVLLGALLALGQTWLRGQARPAPIVVSAALDAALADDFRARRGLAPSEEELVAARARWVRDEALYREARALGLDEGDAIVRRRLVQKMEFLLGASAETVAIDDDARRRFLSEHAAEYAVRERRALRYHYFSALSDAQAARAELAAGRDVSSEPFLGADGWSSISESELGRTLGPASAHQVFELETDSWSEPLAAGRGAILVCVTGVEAAHPPALDSVRSRIDAAIEEGRRAEALEEAVQAVVGHYEVLEENGP